MELKDKFTATAGRALFLDKEQPGALKNYLTDRGFLSKDESITTLEKPGEGNMNFVLRVRTDRQSLIVKQARPWVEKYPQIEAPLERIRVEAEFYQLVRQDEVLASFTPRLIAWDPDNYIVLMEDLGRGADFLSIYQKEERISANELRTIVRFLSRLHHRYFSAEQQEAFPSNQALKKLNHEHIFNFPYMEENGFDLDTVQPGLQALAMPYKKDAALKNKIANLGEYYLGSGSRLIHGDYYPGSWLKTSGGIRIIDPEFAYFGRAEFDLGVMIAHLKMARARPEDFALLQDYYEKPSEFDDGLRQAFTGVEIMRRIIGIAQLPLAVSLAEKKDLMEEAYALI